MPSGRTSMPELQANDLLATHPACSGRRHNQPCRRPHERKLGDQTKDDADKEPREERSCGRSQTSLYNNARPHSALGNLTPTEYANGSAPRTATGRDAALRRGLRAPPRCSTEPYGLKYHRDSSHRWMKQGAQTRTTSVIGFTLVGRLAASLWSNPTGFHHSVFLS